MSCLYDNMRNKGVSAYMKESRLFRIIYHLMENGKSTAPELAEKLEVSVRTIYRDIDIISSAGVPIYVTTGRNGGIQIADSFVLDRLLLSDKEKEDIITALKSVSIVDNHNSDTLSKLSAIFNTKSENWLEVDFSRWGNKSQDNAMFQKVKEAIISRKMLYILLEDEFSSVRKALALAYKYGFGFTLITKSNRVLKDLDLLKAINGKTKCIVQMTLTTYDEDLCKKIEPNVSTTKERVEALKKLHDAGIPTVVWLCPILPFINDTEENIKGILNYCIEAKVYGVICFGMGLTLREGNREYFYSQLDRLFPYLKDKYVQTYGMQYQINSPNNEPLMKLFHQLCEDNGIVHDNKIIFEYLSKFEEKNKNIQLSLFDEFL